MATISDCLHLKVNMKKKNYLYVNPYTQKCVEEIFIILLIEDFFLFATVLLIPVVHLELPIYRVFSEKFEMALNL